MAKPSLPQGTRDFPSEVVRKRNYIFSTIKNTFETYAFQPLETPAIENLDTLLGKYGEEGDRLIFKILNNGLGNPKNIDKAKEGFEKILEGKSSTDITERALKYDLTIPFARYVARNHGLLTFPYRRYQIQPVWRGDRPQKSRYREFTQCDADVVGSASLLNEVELVNIYHTVFTQLGIAGFELRINNRKILSALAEVCGEEKKLTDITVAIDKLDKIGIEKVKEELKEKELNDDQIEIIDTYLNLNNNEAEEKKSVAGNEKKLSLLKDFFHDSEIGLEGIKELEFILEKLSPTINIHVDLTLARGLSYYTGAIFEAKAPAEMKIGSIGGGGRYDNLTGLFGLPDIPGVGISFGVDRIYDVMEEMKLFPEDLQVTTKALFFNMGETESLFAFNIMQELRSKGIACELHYEFVKITKQFSYAEKKNIPYVVIIGSKEIEQNYCLVKHLPTGIQEVVLLDRLFDFFNK